MKIRRERSGRFPAVVLGLPRTGGIDYACALRMRLNPTGRCSVRRRPTVVFATVAAVLSLHDPAAVAQQGTQPRVNTDAKTMAEFTRRVGEYVALHKSARSESSSSRNARTPSPAICLHLRCGRSCGGCWALFSGARAGDR